MECRIDHIHIFVGLQPAIAISDLVQDIKRASNNWINDKGFINGKFSWQDGYGAFTVSHSQIETVQAYIRNQEEHHRLKTFEDEYRVFLERHDVQFDERYLLG